MYSLGFSIGKSKGAVLIKDGKVLIGISEERLSRIKYDLSFSKELPILSIDYCLSKYSLKYSDIDIYTYSSIDLDDNTFFKFNELTGLDESKLMFIPHHLSHACSSFYSSGFQNSVVVVADAMGGIYSDRNELGKWYNIDKSTYNESFNWAEAYSIFNFENLYTIKEVYKKWIKFPSPEIFEENEQCSIGYIYIKGSKQLVYNEHNNTWTAGKLMGLASYADQDFVNQYKFNSKYENFDMVITCESICPEVNYQSDFASKANVAGLYQKNQENNCLHLSKIAKNITNAKNICVSGGSFLNCNTNDLLLKSNMYENYYFVPPSDDSGIPLGCAWYGFLNKKKNSLTESIQLSPYLGKTYNNKEILNSILSFSEIEFKLFDDFSKLIDLVSNDLKNNKVIGWMQGGSEIGPRALGNRSILASPKNSWVVNYINSDIKKREWYRPFAPSVLYEFQSDIFELNEYSPYMLITTKVKDEWKDKIPAVVHHDKTSRVQSVTKDNNRKYYELINKFYEKTGLPVILNTSFNGPSEPIVETPNDAIRTFLNTGLYSLVIENFYITKI